MADNQKAHSSMDSDKKGGKKRKSRSKIKDGVVLRASVIERERERLRRRPRAALYPLLPIMEPTKFRRQSIRVAKSKKRHRKHCRKKGHQVGVEDEQKPKSGLNSRTRLVTTTSESGGSSLACSKLPPATITTTTSTIQCPNCSPVCQPGLLSNWGSIELYADDLLVTDVQEKGVQTMDDLFERSEERHPHLHHHHYHHRHKHRMCHHNKGTILKRLEYKHRSSVTSTRSLDDLRTSNLLSRPFEQRIRRLDPEAGRIGDDKDSTSSNNKSRKIVSFIIGSVASFILLMCVALVAVTLRLTPAIDELVRKENEELYRSMSSGTTGAPVPNVSNVVDNATMVANGQPG